MNHKPQSSKIGQLFLGFCIHYKAPSTLVFCNLKQLEGLLLCLGSNSSPWQVIPPLILIWSGCPSYAVLTTNCYMYLVEIEKTNYVIQCQITLSILCTTVVWIQREREALWAFCLFKEEIFYNYNLRSVILLFFVILISTIVLWAQEKKTGKKENKTLKGQEQIRGL